MLVYHRLTIFNWSNLAANYHHQQLLRCSSVRLIKVIGIPLKVFFLLCNFNISSLFYMTCVLLSLKHLRKMNFSKEKRKEQSILLPTATICTVRVFLSTNPVIFRIIIIIVCICTFLRITRFIRSADTW